MTQHHPAPEILAQYASGALHAGAMLVVACRGSLTRCRKTPAAMVNSIGTTV